MRINSNNHYYMLNLSFLYSFLNGEYEDADFRYKGANDRGVHSYELWYKGVKHTAIVKVPFTNVLEVSDDFEELAKDFAVRLWDKYSVHVPASAKAKEGEIRLRTANDYYIIKEEAVDISFLLPTDQYLWCPPEPAPFVPDKKLSEEEIRELLCNTDNSTIE